MSHAVTEGKNKMEDALYIAAIVSANKLPEKGNVFGERVVICDAPKRTFFITCTLDDHWFDMPSEPSVCDTTKSDWSFAGKWECVGSTNCFVKQIPRENVHFVCVDLIGFPDRVFVWRDQHGNLPPLRPMLETIYAYREAHQPAQRSH